LISFILIESIYFSNSTANYSELPALLSKFQVSRVNYLGYIQVRAINCLKIFRIPKRLMHWPSCN